MWYRGALQYTYSMHKDQITVIDTSTTSSLCVRNIPNPLYWPCFESGFLTFLSLKNVKYQAWCFTSITPATREIRQECLKFRASLGKR
jgi:hypothetical protein